MTYHMMCDPVHGIMETDQEAHDALRPLIDSPHFQRLRRIKQLSFAEYIYPGAVHTRFNHCIGASYLADKVFKALLKNDPDHNIINEADRIPLLIASLLHDIGHGPFSHAFEDVFGKSLIAKHEDWNTVFIDQLSELMPDKGVAKKVKNILSNAPGDENKLLHQIISSQLDVDRFDYLLRDSHFCGVSYGHFDVNWLISCLKTTSPNLIAVAPKGVRAVEHYLMARRLMNHNVYYHKKKCAAENMFTEFLNSIPENSKIGDQPLIKLIHNIKNASTNNADNKKKLKLDDFLKKNFKLYSRLTDNDFWEIVDYYYHENNKKDKKLHELATRFNERKLPKIFQVKPGYSDYAGQVLTERLKNLTNISHKWRIQFDEPAVNLYEAKAEKIYVKHKNSYQSISKESDLINIFSDKPEKFRNLYFYIPFDESELKSEILAIIDNLLDYDILNAEDFEYKQSE